MYFCFFFLLLSVDISISSHFRGGTISWKPVLFNSTMAVLNLTLKAAWTVYSNTSVTIFCDETGIIYHNKTLGPDNALFYSPALPIIASNKEYVYCTDFSPSLYWSYGENTFSIKYLNGTAATTQYISFQSNSWMNLINRGSNYSIITSVNFLVNPNTGQLNQSPTTSVPTSVQIPTGQYTELKIPISDADGDIIRCRWANGTECGDSCYMPPTIVLDTVNCVLSFNLSSAIGYYGIRIKVEDFPNITSTSPMSSVGLQFLVRSYTPYNISSQAIFEPPTKQDKDYVSIPLGSDYNDTIIVNTNNPNMNLTEVLTLSPPIFYKSQVLPYSTSNSTLFYVNVSWTPTSTGVSLFCFMGLIYQLTYSIETEQRCISLCAGYSVPSLIQSSARPYGTVYKNQTEWSIEAYQSISRPLNQTFIRFYENDTGLQVYAVDMTDESAVFINNSQITFYTSSFLANGKSYYINFDSGV